jgi:hypothetical protein
MTFHSQAMKVCGDVRVELLADPVGSVLLYFAARYERILGLFKHRGNIRRSAADAGLRLSPSGVHCPVPWAQ